MTIDAADFAAASGQVTVRRDGTKIRFVNTGTGIDIASAPAHEFANVTSVTLLVRTMPLTRWWSTLRPAIRCRLAV